MKTLLRIIEAPVVFCAVAAILTLVSIIGSLTATVEVFTRPKGTRLDQFLPTLLD